MVRQVFTLIIAIFCLSAVASAQSTTRYSYTECEGSSMPYPEIDMSLRAIPDSLVPVYVNHVGRHGARFMTSVKNIDELLKKLHKADSLGTITPEGRELAQLCKLVLKRTGGRWGALDSLGMAEQEEIATRLHTIAPRLFNGTKVNAISSYVPRCVASMDAFTHQLARLDTKVEIYTSSGRQNSPLMRPWTGDAEYQSFMNGDEWSNVYHRYLDKVVPDAVAERLLGSGYPFSGNEKRDIALSAYKVVAGCEAISINPEAQRFFTPEEYNALWSVANMHHYLTHSASTLSNAPMDLATALLDNLITTMDSAVKGNNEYTVTLRFGHAETMMPLLALMRLPGCYYMTNDFNTVGLHWRDFDVVPMGANLQMILLKSTSTGKMYVRIDVNEKPVILPGQKSVYTPWENARKYLISCLPSDPQP
ncbi:MAG: hypothetical protein NC349_01060 [Paenibacillus sp.]|nr:hypothetical protein [Paenibacillus sp.]